MEIKVDRKAAVKKLKALVLSPKNEVEAFRSKLEKKFKADFIPNHVERTEKKIGGVKCDILVPEIFASNRIVIYVHGGSFVGGSRDSWRSFCSIFANAVSAKVVVPEFRLAPSYPFPSRSGHAAAPAPCEAFPESEVPDTPHSLQGSDLHWKCRRKR